MSRLSRQDWARAALDAIAESGVSAVAVEPIAQRLGATKGSFYWHFRNREALVEAALLEWEAGTEDIIGTVDAEPDPAARLRRLFAIVFEPAHGALADLALLAHADHPLVGPVLRRVTDRRMRYLAALFRRSGFGTDQAHRRALFAYSTYLGHLQVRRMDATGLPRSDAELRAYADHVLDALTSHE